MAATATGLDRRTLRRPSHLVCDVFVPGGRVSLARPESRPTVMVGGAPRVCTAVNGQFWVAIGACLFSDGPASIRDVAQIDRLLQSALHAC
jgi:type IV secretory pathway TrbD component